MPAFKGTLNEDQIKCIATVVSAVSEGGGGSGRRRRRACKDFA